MGAGIFDFGNNDSIQNENTPSQIIRNSLVDRRIASRHGKQLNIFRPHMGNAPEFRPEMPWSEAEIKLIPRTVNSSTEHPARKCLFSLWQRHLERLRGPRVRKRYLFLTAVSGFSGGESPTRECSVAEREIRDFWILEQIRLGSQKTIRAHGRTRHSSRIGHSGRSKSA